MNPQVQTVRKVSQGSKDPDKPWSKAKFSFMKQLAICFGKLDSTITLTLTLRFIVVEGEK